MNRLLTDFVLVKTVAFTQMQADIEIFANPDFCKNQIL